MLVLFSTGSDPRYMLPPSLGDEQINCGPGFADVTDGDGRIRSLKTGAGEYDLAAVAARLPLEQQPDVVVCLVDASWRNLPRRLDAFKCPRVLLVADTHHLTSPLLGMLRYLATETFDRVVFLYDRHHLAFFRAAGIQNLFWFPGLTFPHDDHAVAAARHSNRQAHVGFVGQMGKIHPRRARLLGDLAARKVPVAVKAVPQCETLDFYGRSQLGFNASLNGDLNLRVFEIIAAGAGLLTDRLAVGSGLGELLADGREIVTYGSPGELVERAQSFLAQPKRALDLGAAGAAWFDRHFGETRRRELFRDLVFNGRAAPEFTIGAPRPGEVLYSGNMDRLLEGLIVYEGIQELHRTQEQVRVMVDAETAPDDFAEMCATLPRVEVSRTLGTHGADLAVIGQVNCATLPLARINRVWCWDPAAENAERIEAHFKANGLQRANNDVAVFCRPDAPPKPAAVPTNEIGQARLLFQQGNLNAALTLARSVVDRDPRSMEARLLLGELALLRNGPEVAEKLFRQVLHVRNREPSVETLLAQALGAQKKYAPAADILRATLARAPHHLPALLAMSRLQLQQGRMAPAEAALREAVRHHPASAVAARALGELLKRNGSDVEAMAWQRRAAGENGPVPLIDPDERAVRVAFLVQHPQAWTSLQSVWQAFAGDPAFAVTMIAAPYQHPYPPEGGTEAIYGFLTAQGVPFVRWDEFDFAPEFADVLFVQNPYDVTRPATLRTTELIKRVARLAYVPYGLEIGGGEENAQNQFNLPLQQMAWAVFARSVRHKAMFARHCAVGDTHVTVTGHPRLDTVRNLDAVAPEAEFEELKRGGRRIVCWNPQFDIRPDGTGFSTFLQWQEFFIEEFARRPDLALVIRPHPLFFGTLERRQIWNAAQIADFLARARRAGNVVIDRRASYLPIFAASSAMLSDASTFLLEYAAIGKPLLYLHNPRGPQLNSDGEFIREHGYTAERREDVVAFLDHVAAGKNGPTDSRQAAYDEVMHAPSEGVGEKIKRAVRERLAAEVGRRGSSNPYCLTSGTSDGDAVGAAPL
jgi:tetratricopeptide (TPR) repeat protein